jgi:hypothetical protein
VKTSKLTTGSTEEEQGMEREGEGGNEQSDSPESHPQFETSRQQQTLKYTSNFGTITELEVETESPEDGTHLHPPNGSASLGSVNSRDGVTINSREGPGGNTVGDVTLGALKGYAMESLRDGDAMGNVRDPGGHVGGPGGVVGGPGGVVGDPGDDVGSPGDDVGGAEGDVGGPRGVVGGLGGDMGDPGISSRRGSGLRSDVGGPRVTEGNPRGDMGDIGGVDVGVLRGGRSWGEIEGADTSPQSKKAQRLLMQESIQLGMQGIMAMVVNESKHSSPTIQKPHTHGHTAPSSLHIPMGEREEVSEHRKMQVRPLTCSPMTSTTDQKMYPNFVFTPLRSKSGVGDQKRAVKERKDSRLETRHEVEDDWFGFNDDEPEDGWVGYDASSNGHTSREEGEGGYQREHSRLNSGSSDCKGVQRRRAHLAMANSSIGPLPLEDGDSGTEEGRRVARLPISRHSPRRGAGMSDTHLMDMKPDDPIFPEVVIQRAKPSRLFDAPAPQLQRQYHSTKSLVSTPTSDTQYKTEMELVKPLSAFLNHKFSNNRPLKGALNHSVSTNDLNLNVTSKSTSGLNSTKASANNSPSLSMRRCVTDVQVGNRTSVTKLKRPHSFHVSKHQPKNGGGTVDFTKDEFIRRAALQGMRKKPRSRPPSQDGPTSPHRFAPTRAKEVVSDLDALLLQRKASNESTTPKSHSEGRDCVTEKKKNTPTQTSGRHIIKRRSDSQMNVSLDGGEETLPKNPHSYGELRSRFRVSHGTKSGATTFSKSRPATELTDTAENSEREGENGSREISVQVVSRAGERRADEENGEVGRILCDKKAAGVENRGTEDGKGGLEEAVLKIAEELQSSGSMDPGENGGENRQEDGMEREVTKTEELRSTSVNERKREGKNGFEIENRGTTEEVEQVTKELIAKGEGKVVVVKATEEVGKEENGETSIIESSVEMHVEEECSESIHEAGSAREEDEIGRVKDDADAGAMERVDVEVEEWKEEGEGDDRERLGGIGRADDGGTTKRDNEGENKREKGEDGVGKAADGGDANVDEWNEEASEEARREKGAKILLPLQSAPAVTPADYQEAAYIIQYEPEKLCWTQF